MADAKTEGARIAARCRRIGWQVERGTARTDWVYKITPVGTGNVKPIQIHGTPSDTNWTHVVMRELNNAGFEQAEKTYLDQKEQERQQRLANDRETAEKRTALLAQRSALLTKAAGKFGGPEPADSQWLTTPSQFPETRTVVMTPKVAQHLLDTINTHNRPLRPARVAYLRQVILDGEWSCTHQGGAIDTNGVLQDGQTRLAAIVSADRDVIMQWSVGMPPENFRKVDTGTNRSGRDTAYIRGDCADPSTSAATAKMLVVIDNFGPDSHIKYKSYRVSNDKVDMTIEALGQDLEAAVHRGKQIKKEIKKINPSAIATAIFLIGQRLPAGDERVKKFFFDLEYGLLDSRTDPVYLLRRLLLNNDDARRGYNAWEQLAYILKAWNMRAAGRTVHQLVWRSVEPFPATVFLPPKPTADNVQGELVSVAA